MKKNIVGITVSKNEDEKIEQLSEFETSGYAMYGISHLPDDFTIKEVKSMLKLLKTYGTHVIMLDGKNLCSDIIRELSLLIKQSGLEPLIINSKIPSEDKRYLFLLCRDNVVDTEMILSVLLKQHTTDIYIMIEDPICLYHEQNEKLKKIADILNIELHFFRKIDMK